MAPSLPCRGNSLPYYIPTNNRKILCSPLLTSALLIVGEDCCGPDDLSSGPFFCQLPRGKGGGVPRYPAVMGVRLTQAQQTKLAHLAHLMQVPEAEVIRQLLQRVELVDVTPFAFPRPEETEAAASAPEG